MKRLVRLCHMREDLVHRRRFLSCRDLLFLWLSIFWLAIMHVGHVLHLCHWRVVNCMNIGLAGLLIRDLA